MAHANISVHLGRPRCGTGAEWCPPALKQTAEQIGQMPSCGEGKELPLFPARDSSAWGTHWSPKVWGGALGRPNSGT